MRRELIVGTTVLVVVVLATPAVRRGMGVRLEAAAAGVRRRVDSFRLDYAAREDELRRQLLPDDEQQTRAAQYRADHS